MNNKFLTIMTSTIYGYKSSVLDAVDSADEGDNIPAQYKHNYLSYLDLENETVSLNFINAIEQIKYFQIEIPDNVIKYVINHPISAGSYLSRKKEELPLETELYNFLLKFTSLNEMVNAVIETDRVSLMLYIIEHCKKTTFKALDSSSKEPSSELEMIKIYVTYASKKNSSNIFIYLLDAYKIDIFSSKQSSIIANFARHGNLEIISHLRLKLKWNWNCESCEQAIENHHIELFHWLVQSGCPWKNEIVSIAMAKIGSLELLQWSLDQTPPCPLACEIYRHIIEGGYLEILKWIMSLQDRPKESLSIQVMAASLKRFEILEWCVEIGRHLDPYLFCVAANKGDLDTIKWLRAKNTPWSYAPSIFIFYSGFDKYEVCPLHIIKWCREQDDPPPWSRSVTRTAFKNKQYDTFKWCVENGCDCDPQEYVIVQQL